MKPTHRNAFVKVCVFFTLFLACSSGFAQTRSGLYAIYSDTRELIGQLKVNSSQTDTVTKISVVSQFSVQLVMRVNVKYVLSSVYHNNQLYSNSVITYRNNTVNSVAKTVRAGSQYQYKKDDDEWVYPKAITFAESLLYFNEPLDKESVYSEFDGVDKPIQKVKTGHYQVTNPVNGNISEYFYETGILDRALVHVSFLPLTIERIH